MLPSLFNQANNDALSAVFWIFALIFLISFLLKPNRLPSKLREPVSTKLDRQQLDGRTQFPIRVLHILQSIPHHFSLFILLAVQNSPMGRSFLAFLILDD